MAFSMAENPAWAEANFQGPDGGVWQKQVGLGWLGCGDGHCDMAV